MDHPSNPAPFSPAHNKAALRAYYKIRRSALSGTETEGMVLQITEQFKRIPIQQKAVRYALSYMAMVQANEVDTRPVNAFLDTAFRPGVQITFPRTDFSSCQMEAVLPDHETRFITNKMQLTEPEGGRIIAPGAIDLVIMPLLIFDLKGNRVGYGKGFYDRFLARCRPDVLKIGLCLFPPVSEIEDVSKFDIPLDYCATPDRLYEF